MLAIKRRCVIGRQRRGARRVFNWLLRQVVTGPRGQPAASFAIFCFVSAMRELVRTNDPILLSFIEVLLRDNGILAVIADTNMSVLEGSIGVLPRRVMVREDELHRARRTMIEAELGQWLSEHSDPKT